MPDLNQNENVLSYRSLPNRLVAPAKIPDPSRPGTPTHTKTLDFSGADEKEAGDDITDLGVNDGSHGMMGLILAKNATADNDSESDTDGNEQRNLLDDVMIFVTETKNSSRR